MPFNRQFMGWTGAASASTVVFPPQATLRVSDTGATNDPQSPTELMSAAPNPNEIWRLSAGDIQLIMLDATSGSQMAAGQILVGKRLLGGQGVRWYSTTQCAVAPTVAEQTDQNFALRMQQSMRVHPGETLVLAVNDGGTAWDASDANHQVQIPYEVAAGVTPGQMRASLARWG